ncbi:MAG: 3' terminal RNA ribose 2'-O-methyltransferase Hen1 [Candidatus Thiodiazotropha sp. (ex Lucinoma kastoroae)]|nr:3' terminal RNA ribose 2'-O-methyltransferase Hen1 [Candidatus Thiodiazotropha sp. (ex Lucinoma kastoroae)]
MLLTISTTHQPATDLGYLLHKHPDKLQTFPVSIGKAHVYYPESNEKRCTVALQLEVDPIGLVRSFKGGGRQRLLEQYVNDRPYVASSFLSVALNKVFRSAFTGSSGSKQELADMEIPLEVTIYSVPCRGGEQLLRRLFEPLGYEIEAKSQVLDVKFTEWGDSPYFNIVIRGNKRLCDLLRHVYVLIPVLDKDKHYWVGDDEVEKLLRHGDDWLSTHPEKELIASRYLKSRRSLANDALARLSGEEGVLEATATTSNQEDVLEKPIRLNDQRLRAVSEVVERCNPSSVLDLGCGEGKLIKELLKNRQINEIVGIDVSSRALEIAERRLRLRDMPERERTRIKLINSSLTYRDMRLSNRDLAIAAEVIEHIDLDRMDAFERSVFEFAKPNTVIITTPNSEYNATFQNMAEGQLRHPDHRFEWNRDQFKVWVDRMCNSYQYEAKISGIGPLDEHLGTPTQMAVFRQLHD